MPTAQDVNVLDELKDRRKEALAKWSDLVEARVKVRSEFEAREASDAKPTAEEVESFNSDEVAFETESSALDTEIKSLRKRIDEQEKLEKRTKEAREGHRESPARVTAEPLTYTRQNSMGPTGTSYYRDIAAAFVKGATFQSTDSASALERLQRHAKEMDVEMPKRSRSRETNALSSITEAEMQRGNGVDYDPFHRGKVDHGGLFRGWAHNPLEYRVEPNQTQGQGGYFIPPLWLEDQWIQQLVAHLVIAGLCRQMDLPMGTDSINIPKVATGTAVGYQQANNSGVVTQDWTDTVVTANVKTIAGQSDVSRQLLEQSQHGLVDEVITSNLALQYNQFLDAQVAAGDGLNANQLNGGHLQGIANGASGSSSWSNVNTVTYTAADPAGYQFAQVLAAMASNVAKTRFSAGQYKTVVTGSRWGWYSSAPDANDRPLGESSAGGPWNVQAMIEAGFQSEGLVGTIPHVANTPLYVDYNLPQTGGAGANQDIAISGLFDDAWLFQGALRTNVFPEVLSGGLGIRFQLYNYAAFLLRYGQSFCIASGTGFVPPTGQAASPSWTPASLIF